MADALKQAMRNAAQEIVERFAQKGCIILTHGSSEDIRMVCVGLETSQVRDTLWVLAREFLGLDNRTLVLVTDDEDDWGLRSRPCRE